MDKGKIKACKTLDELVKLWKNEEGHDYFCPDGFIDEETFKEQEKKVLFIAKESNVSKGTDKDFFWLQSVANRKSDSKILSRRISIMANAYFDNNFGCVNKSLDNLQKIAYMNINKRGGGNRSKDNELEEYAKTYKEYIEKEIKIINPDLIVCGSSIVHNIVGGIVERKNDRPYLVEVYHPSYYRISDKEYLKRFYNELKNIQKNKQRHN